MTGRSQILPWWLGGGGLKTTENKTTLAPLSLQLARETGMGWGEGEGGANKAEEGKRGGGFYTYSFSI